MLQLWQYIWQIMSPNSVWPFISVRHDHKQFIILDFRPECGTVTGTVCCQSWPWLFYCSYCVHTEEVLTRRWSSFDCGHRITYHVTQGNCRLKRASMPNNMPALVFFHVSATRSHSQCVGGRPLFRVGLKAGIFPKPDPPTLSAGHKHCFVPQCCSLWLLFLHDYNTTGCVRYWNLQLELYPK